MIFCGIYEITNVAVTSRGNKYSVPIPCQPTIITLSQTRSYLCIVFWLLYSIEKGINKKSIARKRAIDFLLP